MSGSLTRGGGENVLGIPGACATRHFTFLVTAPWYRCELSFYGWTWIYLVSSVNHNMCRNEIRKSDEYMLSWRIERPIFGGVSTSGIKTAHGRGHWMRVCDFYSKGCFEVNQNTSHLRRWSAFWFIAQSRWRLIYWNSNSIEIPLVGRAHTIKRFHYITGASIH